MTENKSLLLYARLAARLEDFMSLRSLPCALFGIYTCVVLRLFFILCILCVVKTKFTLPCLTLPTTTALLLERLEKPTLQVDSIDLTKAKVVCIQHYVASGLFFLCFF